MLGLGNTLSGGIVPVVAAASFANTYSLDFDGSNDHVLGDAAIYDNGSYSIWIKDRRSSGTQILFSTENTFLYMQGSGVTSFYWPRGYSGYTSFTIDVDERRDDVWHHLAITAHRPDVVGTTAEVKLYWDGVLKETDSGTGSGAMTDKVLYLGMYNGGGLHFLGNIDEFGFWRAHTLTGAEVTALYNSGVPIALDSDSGNYASSGNLSQWWRMGDGDTYPTITDNKGSDNGTMTNMSSGDIVTVVPS